MGKKAAITMDGDLEKRVSERARAEGTTEVQLITKAVEAYLASRQDGTGKPYQRMEQAGLIGCVEDAPADLSTNPEYLGDLGRG